MDSTVRTKTPGQPLNMLFKQYRNIQQDLRNVAETARSGRLRWEIENEGSNTQKNLGYELEHMFSCISLTAMQNYYQLLQMAYMINLLVERSNQVVALLGEYSKQTNVDQWKKAISYMLMYQGEECIPSPYQRG